MGAITEDDRGRVLARQIQVAARILTIANVANLASIITTAVFLVPSGAFRTTWGSAFVLLIANSCRVWSPWVRDEHRPAGRREQVLLTVDVAAGGLFYGALGVHVVPQLSGPRQMVLVGTILGVVGAGAIALSTLPSAGLAWLAITLSGVAIGFVDDGFAQLPIALTELALYAAALTVAIAYLSWSFRQRCRAERTAERGLEVVTLLLDDFEGGARDWLWRTDPTGRLASPSSRLAECSGLEPSQLEQRTLLDLVDPEETAAHDHLRRAIGEARAFRDVIVPVRRGADRRWWSLSGAPRPDGSWRGVGADITDTHQRDQEILRLASTDSLTGLTNRHQFSTELRALVAGRADGQRIRLSIIDLDNFKTVNDTLGHPIGDLLLVEVARRLRTASEPATVCARLGGDEFAIVSAAEPAIDHALSAALSCVFDQPFHIHGTRLEVRGSVGQAAIPDDASEADELVMLADLALYAAKGAGSGQVRQFEPGLRDAADARGKVQRDLRRAIADGAFELRFQPMVAPSGHVVAFEALARWHHHEHGWMSPASFIAVAEETGLIVPLGDQLLDQALEVGAQLPDGIQIAVNVAPAQLVSTGFSMRFRSALERRGVAPHQVVVEVTESAVVDPTARRTLEELRHAGCGLAVDDFGTGYSSFAALHDLPITQLKIDRAFIGRLDHRGEGRALAIVQAIVQVAEATGLSCVAEGVENEEQRTIVRALGCVVQGYVEARPMPASEIDGYLAARAGGTARLP